MNKSIIYLNLQGRIGNQLFQYALAHVIQLKMKNNYKIVVDDSRVKRNGWVNSLEFYNLPNAQFVHSSVLRRDLLISRTNFLRLFYKICTYFLNYNQKFAFEKLIFKFYERQGVIICENGFIDINFDLLKSNSIYLEGYFQSEKFFYEYKNEIKSLFNGSQFNNLLYYPGIKEIINRNSVCISVKVEHSVGNTIHNVCNLEYWKKAISYIIDKVDNPLFFICSDNVEYVVNNLIDIKKFDCIFQDKNSPAHISLAAMSKCKHFIIGNTSFGWWAQYLSSNSNKIVCAPSKWFAVDMPVDIYQDNWTIIDV